MDHAAEKGMVVEKRTTSRKQFTEIELQVKLPNIYHFLKTSYEDDEKGCAIWDGENKKPLCPKPNFQDQFAVPAKKNFHLWEFPLTSSQSIKYNIMFRDGWLGGFVVFR